MTKPDQMAGRSHARLSNIILEVATIGWAHEIRQPGLPPERVAVPVPQLCTAY